MAVDTRQKRFSMMSTRGPLTFHPLFEADGSVDLDDRQHLLNKYSGIAFGAPPAPVSPGNWSSNYNLLLDIIE